MSPRLARWLVRTTAALAVVVAVLAAVGWAVLSQPQFGAPIAGARLARALANPQYREGRFVNFEPEDTDTTSLPEYILRQLSGDEVREPPAPVPVLAVDKMALAAAPPTSGLRAFWIGHASTYVEIDGLRVLLDPVFAERVSPLPVGPRRFHPPPIALADLPGSTRCSSRTTTTIIWTWPRSPPGAARLALLRAAGHRRSSGTVGRSACADRGTGMVAGTFAGERANRVHTDASLLRPRLGQPQHDPVVQLVSWSVRSTVFSTAVTPVTQNCSRTSALASARSTWPSSRSAPTGPALRGSTST